MNSCTLMAKVIRQPELRYTTDNQTPVINMMIEFPGLRDDDSAASLKVTSWGKLAEEIHQEYQQGDAIIVEGYININTIDRPEGFKDKCAELVASKIWKLS